MNGNGKNKKNGDNPRFFVVFWICNCIIRTFFEFFTTRIFNGHVRLLSFTVIGKARFRKADFIWHCLPDDGETDKHLK